MVSALRLTGSTLWVTIGIIAASACTSTQLSDSTDANRFAASRARMVESDIEARGVDDPRLTSAMLSVPRHEFVPDEYRDQAYDDNPLPIGEGQTISQPSTRPP